jgi:hypothetical protein
MRLPIKLNDQTLRPAAEVDHERPDWNLPAELHAVEPFRTQQEPQLPLGLGRRTAQLLRKIVSS